MTSEVKRPTNTVRICIDLERFSRIEFKLSFTRLKQSSVVDQ